MVCSRLTCHWLETVVIATNRSITQYNGIGILIGIMYDWHLKNTMGSILFHILPIVVIVVALRQNSISVLNKTLSADGLLP